MMTPILLQKMNLQPIQLNSFKAQTLISTRLQPRMRTPILKNQSKIQIFLNEAPKSYEESDPQTQSKLQPNFLEGSLSSCFNPLRWIQYGFNYSRIFYKNTWNIYSTILYQCFKNVSNTAPNASHNTPRFTSTSSSIGGIDCL